MAFKLSKYTIHFQKRIYLREQHSFGPSFSGTHSSVGEIFALGNLLFHIFESLSLPTAAQLVIRVYSGGGGGFTCDTGYGGALLVIRVMGGGTFIQRLK